MMLVQTSPPAVEPLTLDEAKNHLRVDDSADDALITAQIKAAGRHVEDHTGRQLITATWRLTLDRWPRSSEISLPRPPLISVTSVVFERADGTQGTMDSADYFPDADSEPGRLILAEGASWPGDTLRRAAAVKVTYVAGYGPARTDVPEPVRVAMKTLIGSMYENRESEVVGTIATRLGHSLEFLLHPYRIWTF